jgi:hypothetical protein
MGKASHGAAGTYTDRVYGTCVGAVKPACKSTSQISKPFSSTLSEMGRRHQDQFRFHPIGADG